MAWGNGATDGETVRADRGGYSRRDALRKHQSESYSELLLFDRCRVRRRSMSISLELDPVHVSNRRRVKLAKSYGHKSIAAICRFSGLSRRVVSAVLAATDKPAETQETIVDERRRLVREAWDSGRTSGLAISIHTGLSEHLVCKFLTELRNEMKQQREPVA